jgi:hypothetical protein
MNINTSYFPYFIDIFKISYIYKIYTNIRIMIYILKR